jgi:multicomponent Na+:H+ antiporter subunit B
MRERPILRIGTKLLIPFILLFALYVQFHGDFGPGGGFQAGVIFASAFILYALVFGMANARAALPAGVRRQILALGVLLYAGVGVAGMLTGGNFLDYSGLADQATTGQHVGIFLVELGVGMTVFAAMSTVFFVFASRNPDVREEG